MNEEFKNGMIAMLPRLRRFALARTGDPHSADDLVQATCERAWRACHQLKPGTSLDSWIFTIMKNQHIDDLRAGLARGQVADPEVLDSLPDDRWARRTESGLALAQVSSAISKMPLALREVLALVSIEGMSYREAADVLGIPIGTVMSRLARARTLLMETLGMDGSTSGWVPK